MNARRRYLTGFTAVFTVALMVWTILGFIKHGVTFWETAILVYLVLVGVTLWVVRRETAEGETPSPQTSANPSTLRQISGQARFRVSENGPEEIVLDLIRQKGKVKRYDLMPSVGLSKSSLVRLLDKMEADGKIVQVGERKASFYTLK